ncbi:MAG: hypothetical protein JXB42_07660 [Deltaproteobacteria bacterium]|nr:hypothetical protein [Deltaproteobacteria bacterium]
MSYLKAVRLSLIALVFFAFSTAAQSTLMIDVTGAPGSGTTTWTFSGSTFTESDGTVRTAIADTFSTDDTFDTIRPGGTDSFIPGSPLWTAVFSSVSGLAYFTIGADTRSIAALYLHNNYPRSEDALGIRVDSELDYLADEAASWTGSLLINLDITQLSEGTFINQRFENPEPNFAGPAGDVLLTVASSVQEPSTLLLLGCGLIGLAGYGRKKFLKK